MSDAEEKKCLDLAGKATAHHIKGTLQCVRGLNARDCMHKIKVLDETDLHLGKLIFQSEIPLCLYDLSIFFPSPLTHSLFFLLHNVCNYIKNAHLYFLSPFWQYESHDLRSQCMFSPSEWDSRCSLHVCGWHLRCWPLPRSWAGCRRVPQWSG